MSPNYQREGFNSRPHLNSNAHSNLGAATVLLYNTTGLLFQCGAVVVLWAIQLLSQKPPALPDSLLLLREQGREGWGADGDDPGVRASVHSITYYVTRGACLCGVFAGWSIPQTAWNKDVRFTDKNQKHRGRLKKTQQQQAGRLF